MTTIAIIAGIAAAIIAGWMFRLMTRPVLSPTTGKIISMSTAHLWWVEFVKMNPDTRRTFGGYVDLLKSIGFKIY